MERYHVFKDGTNFGAASTREDAIDLIRAHQKRETHPFLRANFSIIKGEEEFIPYDPLPKALREKRAEGLPKNDDQRTSTDGPTERRRTA